jgi:outer membrane protein insertion porin family
MYRRAYDYRDDLEWPTEGFLLAGEAEGGYAGAGFLRLGFEYDRYQRLANSNFIWAASLAGDVMPFPSDRDDLGINERLFLGGRGSVRGFRGRGIAPKDTGEEDLALGGLTRVVLRNEVRFPLVGDALKGLVFFDAGFLGEDSFEFETPRASTGFGLRLLDERISVGADFGFALNAKSEDDTQVFQFAVDSGI